MKCTGIQLFINEHYELKDKIDYLKGAENGGRNWGQ
jgi:hypothetical protein